MLHARRTIEHSNSVFCLFNLSLLSPGIWPSTSRRTSSTTWSRPSFRKSLVEAHLDSNCKGFGTNYGHVMLCDLTLHKAPLEDVEKLVVQLHRLNHDLVPLLGCLKGAAVWMYSSLQSLICSIYPWICDACYTTNAPMQSGQRSWIWGIGSFVDMDGAVREVSRTGSIDSPGVSSCQNPTSSHLLAYSCV